MDFTLTIPLDNSVLKTCCIFLQESLCYESVYVSWSIGSYIFPLKILYNRVVQLHDLWLMVRWLLQFIVKKHTQQCCTQSLCAVICIHIFFVCPKLQRVLYLISIVVYYSGGAFAHWCQGEHVLLSALTLVHLFSVDSESGTSVFVYILHTMYGLNGKE